KVLSWRTFFQVTEVMLLFLAGSLLLSGIDHLISLGLLPSLSRRLWDTSLLLPDSGMAGGLISGLIGYRARPVLIELLTFAAYWALVTWLLYRPHSIQQA
ncbi:FTR1 family iron permease, partial [Mesorhizobium sp. M4B.F.Ca.ET.049.02.1.2]